MEFIDILDENGNLTGVQKPRREVHEKGLWHRVVHIWIIDTRGNVLIQKRGAYKKTYPNMWAMSCEGHVSAGDSSRETVLKELGEELGLKVTDEEVQFIYGYKRESVTNNGTYFGYHFIDVYLVRREFPVSELVLQESEVDDARWIRIDDLERSIDQKDPVFRDYPGEYPGIFETLKQG